jgi:hypothetical protein
MIQHPTSPLTNISSTAYRRRMTGTGHSHKQRLQQIVTCPDCSTSLHSGSLCTHHKRLHGIDEIPEPLRADRTNISATSVTPYKASFPKGSCKQQQCPVPGCSGYFKNPIDLRTHFMMRHPYDSVHIMEEGSQPLEQCWKCGMHVPYSALNRNHIQLPAMPKGCRAQTTPQPGSQDPKSPRLNHPNLWKDRS